MPHMDKDDFIGALRAFLAQLESEDEADESPPDAKAIYALTGFVEGLSNPIDFQVGDIVMLKSNLFGYRHPSRKFPGIVMEIDDWDSTPRCEEGSIEKRENVLVGCAVPTGKNRFSVAMYRLDERFLMRHDEACLMKDRQQAELNEMLGDFNPNE